MTKITIVLKIAFLFIFFQNANAQIYSRSFLTAEGERISCEKFRGQNIMISILSEDTISVEALNSFKKMHSGINIIAIIPKDLECYKIKAVGNVQKLRKKLAPGIILVIEFLKKDSGDLQGSLFKWLTNKTWNNHFDYDITKCGQTFFVDRIGNLIGVFEKLPNSTSSLVDKMLNR